MPIIVGEEVVMRPAAAAEAMRAMAALAMLAEPAAMFDETGWRGVLAPVPLAEAAGGTRLPGESRRSVGICGSIGIEPSDWRSLILMSSLLT